MGGEEKKSQGEGQGGSGGNPPMELEVDGKKLGVDAVKAILEQNSQLQAAVKGAQPVIEAARRYQISPEELLGQAEGAFAALTGLMEAGLVDEKGKPKTQPKKADVTGDPLVPSMGGGKTGDGGGGEDALLTKVLGGLKKPFEALAQRIAAIEETSAGLVRQELREKVKEKFPDLDDNDVALVFARSLKDKSKGLFDWAKDVSELRKKADGEKKAQWAKELGIDLNAIQDKNKLKEQMAKGGAGVLFEGKKISFRKGDKNSVTPREAAEAFIRASVQD